MCSYLHFPWGNCNDTQKIIVFCVMFTPEWSVSLCSSPELCEFMQCLNTIALQHTETCFHLCDLSRKESKPLSLGKYCLNVGTGRTFSNHRSIQPFIGFNRHPAAKRQDYMHWRCNVQLAWNLFCQNLCSPFECSCMHLNGKLYYFTWTLAARACVTSNLTLM